jgi:hypothetical protein
MNIIAVAVANLGKLAAESETKHGHVVGGVGDRNVAGVVVGIADPFCTVVARRFLKPAEIVLDEEVVRAVGKLH